MTQSDSQAELQAAGSVGMRTQLTSGSANAPVTGSWDDWLVTVIGTGATPTPTSPAATNTPTPTAPAATATPPRTSTPTGVPATATPTSVPATVPATATPTNSPTPTPVVAPSYDDSFSYDVLGNLITKDGVLQQYGSAGNGTGTRPHAARTVGGATYTYDANGNLTTGGGRSLTWNAANQPSQIVSAGITVSLVGLYWFFRIFRESASGDLLYFLVLFTYCSVRGVWLHFQCHSCQPLLASSSTPPRQPKPR